MPRIVRIYRWDLDKTYLQTEFDTLRQLVRTAFRDHLRQIGKLLDGIGAGQITLGGGGADIGPIMHDGVPGLGLRTVGEHYFDWHHTHADTLDKVDPVEFRKCTAAMVVMAYVLADMPGKLTD